jgi:acyl carrier protein
LDADARRRIVAIFADVFETAVDPEGPDLRRDELAGWDSVNHFRLIMELEQAFDVTLADDEVADLMSYREVEALIARRLAARGGEGA